MTQFDQLSAEMQAAFIAFAKRHGRYWKQALRKDWMSLQPQVTGPLRHYRNAYGPRELAKLKVPT